MAAISDYFTIDNTLYPGSGILFYVFDNTKTTSFINDCLVPFRQAYIEDEKVDAIVKKYGNTREDVIARRLPDKGKVMSGDFGEILSLYLASQIWYPNVNVIPLKWRYKDKKKDASHYTDIVLFEWKDPANPSIDDSMVTFEVKTCATSLSNTTYKMHKRKSAITYKDGKLECTILEAVFDANKDAVERAAETLPYLITRCEDLDLDELHNQIERFCNAATTSYRKEHNAVAVVDTSTLAEQIARIPVDMFVALPNVSHVYCVPIDNLKSIYEQVYHDIPTNS